MIGVEGGAGGSVVVDGRVLFHGTREGRGASQLMQSHKQSRKMARMWAVQWEGAEMILERHSGASSGRAWYARPMRGT